MSISIFGTGISTYGTKRHSIFGNISKYGNISKMTTACWTGMFLLFLRTTLRLCTANNII